MNNNDIHQTNVIQSKTILLIDWSNLMFRSLFMHKLYNGNNSGYEREEDLKSFCNKFAMDICSIVNTIQPVHTIICTDSQSAWRKQILPGEDGYKGNREKDPSVNWDNIFKCSDDLLEILKNNGMDVASVEHAEADDIIACVKEVVYANYPEYSLIVVSADADIRQLIDFNPQTKQYCIVYNTTAKQSTKKKYIYVTQSFKDWLEAPEVCDIFFTGYTLDNQKKYINNILTNNANIELAVDEPQNVLLGKVMCGDDGDNVPSFYSYYKNGRLIRVTPKRAEKMLEMMNVKNINDLRSSVRLIEDTMKKVFKINEVSVDCRERLDRQRRLVELNSELFPDNIRNYKDTIFYMIKNINPRPYKYLKANEILKDTEYENWNKRQALEADIFKEFQKMTKKTTTKTAQQQSSIDIARMPGFVSPFATDELF